MKALGLIALGSVLAVQAAAQTSTAPQRDPQAVSLLSQSLAAMVNGGRPIQDLKIDAQVTRTAGSETDTGPATLKAAAYDKSDASYAFTSGQSSETRNGNAGKWSGPDAKANAVALHNTWTGAGWFAPALIVASWVNDTSFSLTYAGLEDRDGAKVQHIRGSRSLNNDPRMVDLSAMDLYLDAQSLVPIALEYNTHPDDDLGVNLAVRVAFDSYQTYGSLLAPSHIQNFLQGSLLLDLKVTATGANNGFGAGDFPVQ